MRTAFTQAQWDELMRDVQTQVSRMAAMKGAEYSSRGDGLAHLRTEAAELAVPISTIWKVHAGKSWHALSRWARFKQKEIRIPLDENIEERFMDLILYSIIGIAIHREQDDNERERRREQLAGAVASITEGNLQRAAQANDGAAPEGSGTVQGETRRDS